jgi:hypothetical protein
MASPGPGSALAGFCLLPAAFGQLAAQTALDWYLVPLRAQLAAGMRCKAGTG